MTTDPVVRDRSGRRPEVLADAVRFEWTKLTTLRSHVATLLGLGLVLPAFAVLVAVTGSLQPDDTVLGASVLAGAAAALIVAVSLGAVSMTGEHRSGMLRVTLTACPQRGAVLAAKALVIGGSVCAVTVVSAAAAFLLGLALLPGDAYATGDPFPALLGVAGQLGLTAMMGVAVGSLVRDSAPAVGLGVALVLLPAIVAPLLGDLARWVGGASLVGLMQKLTQSSDATPERVGSLGAWPSFGVLVASTIAALVVAWWVLDRRDA